MSARDFTVTDADRLAWMDGMPARWTCDPFPVFGYRVSFTRTKSGWTVFFFHGPDWIDVHRVNVATFRDVMDLLINPPQIAPVTP